MSLKGYNKASLRAPATDDAPAAAEWDWEEVLLDSHAYMVDERNHTSASCQFKRSLDGKEVEMCVTLCLAPPPRISYFCCHAYCPDGHGEEDTRLFFREPSILAKEGNLALIILCSSDCKPSLLNTGQNYYEYFVYLAASSSSPAGASELTRLRQPSPHMMPTDSTYCFRDSAIGIVTLPKDDACDAYRIATLEHDYFHDSGHSPFYLCLYDSKAKAWTRKQTAVPQPMPPSEYISDMVITLAGGIMGWVDLWQGMVLCDVLADHTPCNLLRYVPLPRPRQPPNWLPLPIDIANEFRDIVLVKDSSTIRFVDLQVHADPSSPFSETPSGWTVVTWTMEGLHGDLETLGDLRFKLEHELHSRDIHNYNLPKSLFVYHPILSSSKDGVLYLRTNASSATCRNSRVIAVDIKKKQLLKVDEFDMQRPNDYLRTTISSYLMPPVLKANMKRRAPVSPGSSCKKPAITNQAEGEGDVGDAMEIDSQ